MIITLRDAAVARGALPPTSVAVRAGGVRLVAVEGDQRPTVLSLVAAGRMRPDRGAVELRAEDGTLLPPRDARRAVALVDAPVVAQHPDDARIRTVVREELVLAGRRGVPGELTRLGFADRGRDRLGSLGTEDRIRLLTGLASRRPGVRALVVTSPERHGGDPAAWMHMLREIAAPVPGGDGLAVLVVTDAATVRAIDALGLPDPAGTDAVPLFEGTLA